MIDAVFIGQFILKRRKELGLSQNDLAEFLNVSVSSVYKWEKGERTPELSIIGKLCSILEVDIDSFFNGESSLNNNYCQENEFNQMEFSSYFSKLRKINGYSLVSLSEKINVRYQTISKWENGESVPNIITFYECSKLFSVNINEMYFAKKFETSKEEVKVIHSKKWNVFNIILFILSILFFSSSLIINSMNNDSQDNQITVTYEFDKILDPVSFEILKGSRIEKYIPPLEGYNCSYYLNEKEFDFETILYKDTTINCILEIQKFNVYFYDYNNLVLSHQIVEYGKDAVAPIFPSLAAGLEFYKWSIGFECVKEDLHVYPIIINKKADITFNPNGGECSLDYIYDYDPSMFDELPIPYKKGYTFLGWYLEGELFTKDDNVTSPIVLDARYEINEYTITFNELENVYYKNVLFGEEVILEDSFIDGYQFIGWYLGNQKMESTFIYDYEEDIILNAKYAKSNNLFLYVDIDGGVELVTYLGNEINIEIPSKIDNKEVIKLSENLFRKDYSFVKSIKIPTCVKDIGKGALSGLNNIETMYISLSARGNFLDMFDNNIPTSLSTIDVYTSDEVNTHDDFFKGVTNRTFKFIFEKEVVFTTKRQTIYSSIIKELYTYNNASFINLRDSVSLVKISILGDETKIIESPGFKGCSNLKTVVLSESIERLGAQVFEGCGFEYITIPPNVTYLEGYTFRYCKSLKNIVIPNNLERLTINTFEGCTSLNEITLPASLKRIDGSCFLNSKNIKRVNYKGTLESWKEITFFNKESNPLLQGAKLYIDNVLIEDEEIYKNPF